MTKKSILLLNTDHTYYHYKPQLVPLQASAEAMTYLLLASKLIIARKLQAHKLQYDLCSYLKANYIDTASPNHEVDDNLYITLPDGTDESAIFPTDRQKCKSTIDCATRTRAHAQLIASFPWTPARRVAYSHL
jgi:hypothetical protein